MRDTHRIWWLWAWAACAISSIAHAQPDGSTKAGGIGPDGQLTGGAGFAFGKSLDNYFLGRARVGLLYAHEPWIANLGVTLEVGALAGLGIGGELELNGPQRLFGNVGVERVRDGAWMTHVALGWLVFGMEWQHSFTADLPRDALLWHVRLPLGMWWLQQRQQRDADRATRRAAAQARARPLGPQPSLPSARLPNAPHPSELPTPQVDAPAAPQAAEIVRASLDEAAAARERGDTSAEALALARAYTLLPHPSILLQLSAAEEKRGKWLLARSDLRRALARSELTPEEREQAQAREQALAGKLPRLRITLSHATGDEQALIDGVIEPSALLGYDVPVDPGQHVLIIQRQDRTLAEQRFEAAEAQLVRVTLELPRAP